jgi:hypothetical protein
MRRILKSVLILVALLGSPVADATAGEEPTTPALYDGRIIDLAVSWEGASACAVLSATDARCFDSQEELETELGASAARAEAAMSLLDTYCLNRTDLLLTLYADTNYGGSSLNLVVADVWHDLSSYSFDETMSSWKNNTYCDATAAWNAAGGGTQTTLGARNQASTVGSWDNNASSVYLTS